MKNTDIFRKASHHYINRGDRLEILLPNTEQIGNNFISVSRNDFNEDYVEITILMPKNIESYIVNNFGLVQGE